MNLKCKSCGGDYKIKPSRAKKSKYCSRRCLWNETSKRMMIYNIYDIISKIVDDKCMEWPGVKDKGGYGHSSQLLRNGRGAHIDAYLITYGPIPKGMFVCHKCDNPPCINPKHLFLGTPKDNADDRDNKNRVSHGESHPLSKLKISDVIKIRSDQRTHEQIAQDYNVSSHAIWCVINRKTWNRI